MTKHEHERQEPKTEPHQLDEPSTHPAYTAPQLVELASAIETLRSTPYGNARDSQNWYCYP